MLVPAKFEDMTIQFAECIFQMSSETFRRKNAQMSQEQRTFTCLSNTHSDMISGIYYPL